MRSFPDYTVRWLGIFLLVGLLLPLLEAFRKEPGSAPLHPAVFSSAWLAMLGWFGGAICLIGARGQHHPGRAAQWLWTLGSGFQLLHVLLAYHLAHAWSQESAFVQTREIGGVGEGLYVNYAFVLIWLIDAAILCLAPRAYQHRARWRTILIHGFLAFIVFNAMVVFGSWRMQLLFGLFGVVFVLVLRES